MQARFPNILVAFALTVAACGTAAAQPDRVVVRPRASPVESVDVERSHVMLDAFVAARNVQYLIGVATVEAVVSARESAALRRNVSGSRVSLASGGRPAVSDTPGLRLSPSIASVMACIKNAESGNYAESSHPGSGSGAFQYTPGTWEAWSARAGYAGYAYAYEAPPSVQDAVTVFTLTHGGAGNWSPRYGADSCTVGMGG